MALFEQLVGLALLLGVVWLGWRRWIEPYREGLDSQGIGLLMLAVLAIAGGFIGSPFWWIDDPDSFSWALPPLASRLLAAAGFAFAVAGCYALEQRRQELVRSYIVMLAVYLVPLVVAILLFHLDRFNWRAPITYVFFAIAAGMAAAAVWHIARKTTLSARFSDQPNEPVAAAPQAWLGLIVIVAGLWALALLVYPQGPVPQIWLWPQDPLTSRLIGAMLLTIAAGALLALRSAQQAMMSLWMFVTYGIGGALACGWNGLDGKPVPLSYAAAFCMLALISLAILVAGVRKAAPPAVRSPT